MKALFGLVVLLLVSLPVMAQVSVSGEGVVHAVPDVITVHLSVVTEETTASDALNKNNTAMGRLFTTIHLYSIDKKDVSTTSFDVSPKYVYKQGEEPKLVGYTVVNSIAVRVVKKDIMGKMLDNLIQDGANRVERLTFSFSDPEKMLDKARLLAIADAKRKAELYATGAGAKLGRVTQITETDRAIRIQTRAFATSDSSRPGGSVPIEAGTQDIRISVSVVWELK